MIDDASKVYGFARTDGTATALVALNRDGAAHSTVFSGLDAGFAALASGADLDVGWSPFGTDTLGIRSFNAAGKYADTARVTTPVTLETFVVE